ncbi:hypothetical protein DTO282E5_5896 [Paecilomyces variotii]|nr:hypothetical protein DTO282E5_5896 [Paecilomyces variotii]KAJ9380815.1 hypothetical protein DTO063F5_6524 [Paecilomyces variotii]
MLDSGHFQETTSITMAEETKLTPLETFAQAISASAKTIATYCRDSGHPQLSDDNSSGLTGDVLPPSAPQAVTAARQTILEASYRLQQLVTEPSQYLPRLTVYPQHLAALRWLCHFRIPELIPVQGTRTYYELATEAKVPLHQLQSIARMAITGSFLREPEPNIVAHSRTSAHFVENPSLRDWTLFLAEDTAPMAMKLVEATEKWGDTRSKTETAFNLALGTDLAFFKYLSSNPQFTQKFSGYMKNVTASEGTSIKHLVNGFDWASLGNAIVVDVGGSTGHASIALAESFPDLKFIVQDLPMVTSTSKDNREKTPLPETVASRISFESHDFFKPQPVQNADVYLLRMILHDWSFKEAGEILANLVPSVKQGARILIMDTVLPRHGTVPVTEEALLRVRDMTMMETFNSHEREIDEWKDLIQGVHTGLRVQQVIQPAGSSMAIIEVVRG